MKIHKKSAIAVVLAVVILLVIGSCAAANASTRKGACVSKREWKSMRWDSTVNANARHFGTRGFVWALKTQVVSGDPLAVNPDPDKGTTFQTMTVMYDKCGPNNRPSQGNWWGKHQFVKVIYVGWWPNVVTKFEGFDTLNELRVGYAQS